LEWAGRGIRVNAFNPGYMEHPMTGTEGFDQSPEIEAEAIARTPMRRRGRVEELVGPAIFLASDAASFMPGTVLPVHGGWGPALAVAGAIAPAGQLILLRPANLAPRSRRPPGSPCR